MLSIPLIAVCSWIFSMYGDSMANSILDADGIRWSVSNMLTNIYDAPIIEALLLLITLSVLNESGLLVAIGSIIREHTLHKGSVSLKQRRALMMTLIMLALFAIILSFLIFAPGAILLSAFGKYESSALSHGMWGLVTVLVIILSNVYGYSSGKLVTKSDFTAAHTYLVSDCAGCFITMFLSAEVLACLKYTGLLCEDTIAVLSYILYIVPLLVHCISSLLSSNTYQTKPFTHS